MNEELKNQTEKTQEKHTPNANIQHLTSHRSNGITLIALIITIIVLLILAMVAIRAVSGDGILFHAKEARDKYNMEQLKEDVNAVLAERRIAKYTDGELGDLKTDLEKIEGAQVEEIEEGIYTVTKDGNTVTVYEDEEVEEGKTNIWDGTSSEVPEMKEFNWYIYNGSQLKFLADFVNNGNSLTEAQKELVAEKGYQESDIKMNEDITVYLMDNIDLGGRQENGTLNQGSNWTPIGKSKDLQFLGTFEGNNYTIRGVYAKVEGDFAGIFGNSNTIQNLTIKNSYIEATGAYAGGIVGTLRTGEIINCHNIGTEVVTEGGYAGGIVGQHTGTTTTSCSNTGTITSKQAYVGGIIGDGSTCGSISNCTNNGRVTAGKSSNGYNYIGGIVGIHNSEISNCRNEGNVVTDDGVATGGIVGCGRT